ncbi:MAG TPA: DUF1800 domain-containing protein [Bryobacteraceae bacterium]|nr:DUF1800 domain-containing protein [Bryobacteraceae bacterium]
MRPILCLLVLSFCAFSQQMTGRAAARFLDQATWGPTPQAIDVLEKKGITDWLEEQYGAKLSDLPDQPLLDSAGKTNQNLAPVTAAFFQNAVNGPDQLRQRVAFALSEIWVVSQTTVPSAYAFPPYWRIFRDNAFKNYRDVIKAVTLSPAMGKYLNMANNNKANPAKGTAANENYARELMQLFTLGLTELNPDGSPVLDSSHSPVPTYNQAVVTNMAKVLTGWTYPVTPGTAAKNNNPAYYFGQMYAVEAEHDTTSKAIFNGLTIPAGQTADQDLDTLIDDLMAQPTMAPFVSQQLIQHLVTSNPSPAYIQRVSEVFSSMHGALRPVVAAILTDPEARAGDVAGAAVSPGFGHLREPVLFLASMLRGLNASVGPANTLNGYSQELGQNLFVAPSVFSYFSPQYQIEGGLLGPEFQIHSTQTSADRANIVSAALYGTLDKTTTLNLTPFVDLAGNVGNLVNYIGYIFVHSGMSAVLTQAATAAAAAQSTPLAKAQAALYVVLTSSECQVIH